MGQPDQPTQRHCFACGGTFEAVDGPVHEYMLSTPGCWAAYGELLAREYENPALFGAAHRLTVDAYALQHPGDPGDRRAMQSVWVHFVALHLVLEGDRSTGRVPAIMQRLAARKDFPMLPDPPRDFAVTHADVLARPSADHVVAVRDWAACAYRAWQPLRSEVELLLATL